MRHLCIGIALLTLVLSITQCRRVTLGDSRKAKMEPQSTNASEAQQDPLENPAEITVTGEYLSALLVAYEDFQKDPDIPAQKKRITNYSVEFRQDRDNYIIFFFAKRPPSEQLSPGGESSLGKDVSYKVRKRDYQITAKSFYR